MCVFVRVVCLCVCVYVFSEITDWRRNKKREDRRIQ